MKRRLPVLQRIVQRAAFVAALLLVHLAEGVEDEVCVAERLNPDGELAGGLVEVEGAARDFYEEAEGERALRVVALRVHDAAVVEEDATLAFGTLDGERARELRVLYHVNGVEDRDGREVARERYRLAALGGLRRRGGRVRVL